MINNDNIAKNIKTNIVFLTQFYYDIFCFNLFEMQSVILFIMLLIIYESFLNFFLLLYLIFKQFFVHFQRCHIRFNIALNGFAYINNQG